MLTSGRRELMDLDIWGRWPPALILFSKNAEHADATTGWSETILLCPQYWKVTSWEASTVWTLARPLERRIGWQHLHKRPKQETPPHVSPTLHYLSISSSILSLYIISLAPLPSPVATIPHLIRSDVHLQETETHNSGPGLSLQVSLEINPWHIRYLWPLIITSKFW